MITICTKHNFVASMSFLSWNAFHLAKLNPALPAEPGCLSSVGRKQGLLQIKTLMDLGLPTICLPDITSYSFMCMHACLVYSMWLAEVMQCDMHLHHHQLCVVYRQSCISHGLWYSVTHHSVKCHRYVTLHVLIHSTKSHGQHEAVIFLVGNVDDCRCVFLKFWLALSFVLRLNGFTFASRRDFHEALCKVQCESTRHFLSGSLPRSSTLLWFENVALTCVIPARPFQADKRYCCFGCQPSLTPPEGLLYVLNMCFVCNIAPCLNYNILF